MKVKIEDSVATIQFSADDLRVLINNLRLQLGTSAEDTDLFVYIKGQLRIAQKEIR